MTDDKGTSMTKDELVTQIIADHLNHLRPMMIAHRANMTVAEVNRIIARRCAVPDAASSARSIVTIGTGASS